MSAPVITHALGAQVLVTEHATTADLPDGRQMPPPGDGWHAIRRTQPAQHNGRRIVLHNPHE
jgi:hypothetical protein